MIGDALCAPFEGLGGFDWMSVYTIVSEQDVFAKSKIDGILRHHHIARENVTAYDMTEVNIREAIFDVQTLPFLSDRKAVLIRNPEFLTGSMTKKIVHDMDAFMAYLGKPSPDNVLIIYAPYAKLDERKKVTKLLKKSCNFIASPKSNDSSVFSWAKERLASLRIDFDMQALNLLLDITKKDMTLLDIELRKIEHYFLGNDNRKLTRDIVGDLVHQTPEDNVFLLTEALSSKNIKQAHAIYSDLMKNKEEPIKLLIMIGNHFRLLRQVHSLKSRGAGQSEVTSGLGIHPYRAKLLLQQVGQFSLTTLNDYINFIADMDFQIKSGGINGSLALEFIILNAPY